jgi:hypothetical protein
MSRPGLGALLAWLLLLGFGSVVILQRAGGPEADYLAGRDLPANHLLAATDLAAPERSARHRQPNAEALAGRYLATPLAAGTPVRDADLRSLPDPAFDPGRLAIAVPIVAPGDARAVATGTWLWLCDDDGTVTARAEVLAVLCPDGTGARCWAVTAVAGADLAGLVGKGAPGALAGRPTSADCGAPATKGAE